MTTRAIELFKMVGYEVTKPDEDDVPDPPIGAQHIRWLKIGTKWQCFYTAQEFHDAATCKWCTLK